MRTNGTDHPWTRSSRSRKGSRWGSPPHRLEDAAVAASAAVEDGATEKDAELLGAVAADLVVVVGCVGGGGEEEQEAAGAAVDSATVRVSASAGAAVDGFVGRSRR